MGFAAREFLQLDSAGNHALNSFAGGRLRAFSGWFASKHPRQHRSRKRNYALPGDRSSRKVCARNVEISGPHKCFAFGLLLIINPVVCRFFRFGTLLTIERLQDHGQ